MTSFVSDDLSLEMERYLRIATEVCIATAFVNFEGVYLFKQFVEKTRQTRSYTINFLLDQNFHPHPAAREAIIRELCSIPGAKVRVFSDDDRRLHMKVYIFSAGNTVSVIAGSHNVTGAGLKKNIEAGLLTSNRQAVREARQYFNEYWSKGTEAIPNPDVWYRDPLFQPGQLVRHRSTLDCGIIAMVPHPELLGRLWHYNVHWTSQVAITPSEHQEQDLQPMTVVETEKSTLLVEKLLSGENDSNEYIRALLRRKLLTPVKNGLFSYMSSRTDIVAYQFKPLFKILKSDSYRILIADEVGLGKTIEAGIIFTELKARLTNFHRVLIVCPTNLKTKWKDEMESRFDEYFQLLTREDFLRVLRNGDESCFGIVSYEFLGQDDMIETIKDLAPQWDMIILDEAHHVRNKNKRNKAVTQLTRRTTALVMLSATPINLGLQDLTHLLQILLPHDYRDVDDVEFGHRLEPNRYLFEALELVNQSPKSALAKLHTMERSCKHAHRVIGQPAYQRVHQLLTSKDNLDTQELARIKDDLTNLNTLANVISRTRKEDVGAGTPRDVVTRAVEFSDHERALYDALTDLARTMASTGKGKNSRRNSLAVMMPQRQAASSLPAALEYIRDMVKTKSMSTYDIAGDAEDSEEEGSTEFISQAVVLAEAQVILDQFDQVRVSEGDTKYANLVEFLRTRCFYGGRLDKVIIFTSFRKTLAYLQRRLEADFGPGATIEIHGDIQPLTERDARRARFETPAGPSILLCTEVGSEGLDMQFANKLVNYDLPWNPMRVEQRIGRIDRHGQTAEKLLVLNFTSSKTIEDNVIARLIERVRVFRDSLGPLNQVIGEVVQKLQDDLLNPSLTDSERTERARKYELALEVKARAEARFQEGRKELIGQDKNFSEEIREIQQNRRFVSGSELAKVVEVFCSQYPEEATLQPQEDNVYLLTVKGIPRKRLVGGVRTLTNMNETKRERYLGKLATGTFRFTTEHSVAVKRKDLEFFTLHHPVIASIVTSWSPADKVVTGCFVGTALSVPTGSYLLFTYYCEYERNHFQPAVYVYNVAVDLVNGLPTQLGDDLYHLIPAGTLRISPERPALPSDVIDRANQSVKNELTRIINQTATDLQRDQEILIRQQAEVIQTAGDKEIVALSQRRRMEADNRKREAITKQIEEKKAQLAQRLEGLNQDPGDVVAKPTLVGVAWCMVKSGEEREDER